VEHGRLDAADEIYGPDYVNHQHHDPNDPRDLHGTEAMKQFAREFREGFLDFHDSIDLQIAEDDMVATRFTSTGTHRGTFMGVEPTNREVSWTGITIDRIADARIVETWWTNWDTMGMLQQLGALSQTSQE
jgi:predicted ester cyclase